MDHRAKQDDGISFVRLISMLMIIACHIFQYFENGLAGWLNCGVQIFLFMSGFLYGGKKIESTCSFFHKQIPKILIDYYSCLIFIITVYFFFSKDSLVADKVFKAIFLSGTLDGAGHLWFIPTILFCYILTPALCTIIDKIITKKHRHLYFILILLFIHIEIKLIVPYFIPAWINCYLIGLFIGKLRCNGWEDTWKKNTGKVFIPLCIIMNGIQIAQDYYLHLPFPTPQIQGYWLTFRNYAHVFLGITIFLLLYKVFYCVYVNRKREKEKTSVLLRWSDKYSYIVFLAHNIWLNSTTVCIWELDLPVALQSVIICVLILAESFFIVWCSKGIRYLLHHVLNHKIG